MFVISFQRFGIYVLAAFASQSKDNFNVVRAVEILVQRQNEMNRALGHLCAHIG